MARVGPLLLSTWTLLLAACADPPAPAAPPGLVVSGPAAGLRPWLARLGTVPPGERPTRLGLSAQAAAERLAGCPAGYRAHAEDGRLDTLLDKLACADGAEDEHRVFGPVLSTAGARLQGQLRGTDAELTLALAVPPAAPGWTGLFVVDQPATKVPWTRPDDAVAFGQAHAAELPLPASVLHALGRDLNALEAAALQALFTGRWAFVLRPPGGDPATLRLAVALEARDAGLLARGLRTELDALRERFGFGIAPAATPGGGTAQCATGLSLVPGFAPCLTTHGRWLVVGWNAASMPALGRDQPAPAAFHMSLEAFAPIDAGLGGPGAAAVAYPFARVDARLSPGHLDVTLPFAGPRP